MQKCMFQSRNFLQQAILAGWGGGVMLATSNRQQARRKHFQIGGTNTANCKSKVDRNLITK